jgi:hypothetical protein
MFKIMYFVLGISLNMELGEQKLRYNQSIWKFVYEGDNSVFLYIFKSKNICINYMYNLIM